MRRNHKGFTLVELIVVIAIMSLLITGGLVGISLAVGQNIKGCAKDIQGYIAQTKVQALSRETATLTLFSDDTGVYANLSVDGRDVKLGRPSIEIKYHTSDNRWITLSNTERLVLSFDRSSGAFTYLPDGTNSYCTEILLTAGNRKIKITLIPQTGKYYAESV